MTSRAILKALAAAVLIVPLMAAAAFGLLTLSVATADHADIARAIAGALPEELGFPVIDQRRNGWREGFFPECAGLSLLLGEASAASSAAAVIRSETLLPPPERTICADLQAVLRGAPEDVTWFTYARYWHGSLLLHRGVLSVSDYGALQSVAFVAVGLAMVLLWAALAWRVGWAPASAIGVTLALLMDVVAVGLLPMQAVSVAAMLGCAAAFAAWAAPRDGAAVLAAAGVAGAAYNFFDFFCNPECLAALCAWAWAACGLVRGDRRTLFGVLCVFAAVLGGYALFWAAKWGIAAGYAAAAGDTLYLFSGGDAERWGPGTAGWFPGLAAGSVIGQAFDAWWKGGVAVAVGGVVLLCGMRAAAWRGSGGLVPLSERPPPLTPRRKGEGDAFRPETLPPYENRQTTLFPSPLRGGVRGGGRAEARKRLHTASGGSRSIVLLLPIALAWVGIEAISGHTVVHTAITFRIVPVTLALLLASALVLQMTSFSRKAAMSAAE
jgi:hypothetical protein